MSDVGRTLVIVLSMHRSGSSLSTSILQEHGMSLGPFELLGANPGNPHGHFEAEPILELSREVQMLACSFSEDVPDTPESLSRFLESQGVWEDRVEIPARLLERGREIVDCLIKSGPISGFKDPRTVLIWPFWVRVLAAFPDARIVPIVLLRSPHEIAMSVFTRSRSSHGYKTSLDVTTVHLRRLAAIVEGWPEPVCCVRFGTPYFESDLARAVEGCGMSWNPDKGRLLFDRSCIHHDPATIAHEAQRLYESLCGGAAVRHDPAANLATLEADAFARESVFQRRIEHNQAELDELCHRLVEAENRLGHAQYSKEQAHEGWQRLRELWEQSQQRWDRTQAELEQARNELRSAQDELRRSREAFEQAQHQLQSLDQQLDVARAEASLCRTKLHRFDAHPVLGPVLRGRRRVKVMIRGLRSEAHAE